MSNDINKRIERIREFFRKKQPQNHPITGHPVARCDEYVKGLYFDMLCVMAMYENDDAENQNRFIGRLMAGSGDTLSITDHIKRAMEITPDKVNELIVQVKSGKLAEILFIDSLIISCANGLPDRKQTEFLAELADMLGLNKPAVECLCGLAAGILEQDLNKIKKCDVKGLDAKNISASVDCYIRLIAENGSFVNTDISLDPKTVCYYSTNINKKALFDKERELKNYDSVTAENITFNSKVKFTSIPKVRFFGCVFENITDTAVSFDYVKEVRFEKCIFRNLGQVMFFASSDTKVTVTDCSFEDCKCDSRSVIIASSNSTPIEFKACVFKNISGGYFSDYGVISTRNSITARDCEFYNCKIFYASYLFITRDYKESNNTYSDCCHVSHVKG